MNHQNECMPVQARDIPLSLEQLSAHISILEDRVEALRDRLNPALVHADTKAEAGSPTLAKAISVIAECVDGYTDRVSLANYKLERLLAELQI